MSEWFDRSARRAAGPYLTPPQQRKVDEIKAAIGKSDRAVYDHLYSIATFERSAQKANTGRIFAEWPARIAGLRNEAKAAHDRLSQLHTGLRAELRLREGLTELAGAFDAWHHGLTSTNLGEIDAAIVRMKRHFARAGTVGKAGVADLKRGM